MDAKERAKLEHLWELSNLRAYPSDENIKHWINYARGANHFFTNVRYDNVEELFEQVCHDFEIHPAFETELYNAQEAVSKAFDIQEMLKERFGFTQKKYFRDKKGLMRLIYGEAPKGYYSAKTHSFALLLNLPKESFKDGIEGYCNGASFYNPDTMDSYKDMLMKGKDYIPSLDDLCIKCNAFNKSSHQNKLHQLAGIHNVTPDHELKHLIDKILHRLNNGDCSEFSADLYSEGPNKQGLNSDINHMKSFLQSEEAKFLDQRDRLIEEEHVDYLENNLLDVVWGIREQGLSFRDLSFIVYPSDSLNMSNILNGIHDYLKRNPLTNNVKSLKDQSYMEREASLEYIAKLIRGL